MNFHHKNTDTFFTLILVEIAFVYLYSVGTNPIIGDGLAFSFQVYNGFDISTNATNYFLYTNFLAFSYKIIPFVNIYYLFVSISVIFSLLTLNYLKKYYYFLCQNNELKNLK